MKKHKDFMVVPEEVKMYLGYMKTGMCSFKRSISLLFFRKEILFNRQYSDAFLVGA